MPSYPSHSVHRRSSGGGAVFSSDDFKFRQGTCFYIALPVGIVATINMVLLLVEGITRVKNAPEDEEVSQMRTQITKLKIRRATEKAQLQATSKICSKK